MHMHVQHPVETGGLAIAPSHWCCRAALSEMHALEHARLPPHLEIRAGHCFLMLAWLGTHSHIAFLQKAGMPGATLGCD